MKVNLLMMKYQKIPPAGLFNKVFLTFFGSGLSPIAPGTMGSIATLPLIYLLSIAQISLSVFLILTTLLTVAACIIAERVQKQFGLHDPQWIVIDEVIGMLVTWAFIYPHFNLYSATLLFILFRFFDIIKIFPASYFDKKIKNGAGTIIDDVISAFYAGGLLWLIQKYTSIF